MNLNLRLNDKVYWMLIFIVMLLGCILCELLTGYPLLPGEDEGGKCFLFQCQIFFNIQYFAGDQLSCIIELLGMPPQKLLDQSKRAKNFISSKGKIWKNISLKIFDNNNNICLQVTLATARPLRYPTEPQFSMEVEVVEANHEVPLVLGNFKQHWRDVMILFSLTSSGDVLSGIQQRGWLPTLLSDTHGSGDDYQDLLRYVIIFDNNRDHTLDSEMKVH